jgi:hypothetical protein
LADQVDGVALTNYAEMMDVESMIGGAVDFVAVDEEVPADEGYRFTVTAV